MIIYFKAKKAMKSLHTYVSEKYCPCKITDANTVVLKINKIYPCIQVKTDTEKKIIIDSKEIDKIFINYLVDTGLTEKSVNNIKVRVESGETVNRDWNGNWFYALFK